MPSTTGSTASRWEGLDASTTSMVRPERPVNLPRKPLWYLTSPEPCTVPGVDVALELLEQLPVALADDVDEHVEPAPVGHAEHGLRLAGHGGVVEDGVDQRNGRLATFEAEALLADVLGVEELLQRLGGVEPVEDPAVLVRAQLGRDPSTCSWIQRFCSGSWMCMYSTPTVRQ